jgi:hypothetical protein
MYGNASMYLFAIIAINIKKELIKKNTSKTQHQTEYKQVKPSCKPIVNHTKTSISNN